MCDHSIAPLTLGLHRADGAAKVDWVPRVAMVRWGASGPLVAGPIRTVALQAIDNGYMCGHSQQNWISHSCYT